MSLLTLTEQRMWAAGEYALRRAREELDRGGDLKMVLFDLTAATHDLAMTAKEILGRLEASTGPQS